jgi:hypothetical protein
MLRLSSLYGNLTGYHGCLEALYRLEYRFGNTVLRELDLPIRILKVV